MIAILTPKDTFLELSRALREHRIARNMTQVELADRSGVSVAVIRKFEQTGKISLESFIKLTFVLGLNERLIKALQPQTQFASMDELLKASEGDKPALKTAPRFRKKARKKKVSHD